MATTRPKAAASTVAPKKSGKKGTATTVPTKPGTHACVVFNKGHCTEQDSHPEDRHMCSYCLTTIRYQVFIRTGFVIGSMQVAVATKN